VDPLALLAELGLTGAGYAARLGDGAGAGFFSDELVTPASVMKIQVALTVENAIATGELDGQARRFMSPGNRTPGPIGMSLMRDEVSMSVRDLAVAMLTISDNVATDELIALVGVDQINATTRSLGMERTLITSDLRDMLDDVARECGFSTYTALAHHNPVIHGPPTETEIRRRIAGSAALDPTRGTRTTAAETVALLSAIWSGRADHPRARAAVRDVMARQLTRHRIATAFGPEVNVAAKSGGLLGIVRNEAGVVAFPDGSAYAVAVFTRAQPDTTTDPSLNDVAIGQLARTLIDQLRT
jgi:beta-lactamase class A